MKEVSSRFGMVTVATAEAENVLNHNDTNTNGAVGQKRKPNNDDENPSTSTTLARPSYRRRMRDERIIMSAAEAMNPARRCTMEDVCVLRPAGEWDCPDESVTYVGVYDGHGGMFATILCAYGF